jgi:hypothetical protein
VNEHVAPWAQASSQEPLEQATVQVPPLGHDVLQWPDEQSTLHVPAPQYVKQWPLEQSSVHCPDAGQVSSQLPPEQSVVHGGAAQDALQLPEAQLQLPPVHGALLRAPPVPGSAMAGPPFGVPVVVVVLEPPHAANTDRARKATYEQCMIVILRRQTIRSGVGYSPPR